MADDSQGFDWSALLQSATPFAAALIPAALGAAAGGKGAALTGAATGFAAGMHGQTEAQELYNRQLAQVQEFNVKAQMEREEQALRAQELKIRTQNYARQDQLAAMQIPHLEAQTREINQKIEHYKLSEENALKWGRENLRGADLDSFLAGTPEFRDKRRDRWETEQKHAAALPGLIAQVSSFGLPADVARSVAAEPKGFDQLREFYLQGVHERNKPREPSYGEVNDDFNDPQGRPVLGRFNRRTGVYEFQPAPPGYTRVGKGAGAEKGPIVPGSKEAAAELARIRDDARQLVEGQFKVGGPMGAFIDFKKLDPDPQKGREKLEALVRQTEERMITDAESRGIKLRKTAQPEPTKPPPDIPAVTSALQKARPAASAQGVTATDPETGLRFESVQDPKTKAWKWEVKR